MTLKEVSKLFFITWNGMVHAVPLNRGLVRDQLQHIKVLFSARVYMTSDQSCS